MASKKCPNCGLYNAESILVCECGHDFAAAELTQSTRKVEKCPHCGAEVFGNLNYCRNCGREFGGKSKVSLKLPELTWRVDPFFWPAAFATLVILGLVSVGFYYVKDSQLYLWPFLGASSLLLSIMATKGRFDYPKWYHYIITLLVSLVPLLGTCYALYFAGKYLARFRKLVILTLVFVLLLWAVSFSPYYLPQLTPLAANFVKAPAATSQPVPPTATQLPTFKVSTPTLSGVTAEPTAQSTVYPTLTSRPTECILWSEITPDDIGKTMCVYGTIYAIVFDGNMYYVSFGKFKVGDFYLAIYSRNYKPSFTEGDCIEMVAEISAVGNSPVIASNGFNLQVSSCNNP